MDHSSTPPGIVMSRPTRKRSRLAFHARLAKRALRRLRGDERGTTSLEWALLLGAIALPSLVILTMCLGIIVDYYRMMTQISSLPLP